MKYFYLAIILLIICSTGCNDQKKSSSDPGTASAENQSNTKSFVAEPQVVSEKEIKTLSIGEKAPEFNLPGIDGKFYSLEDFDKAKALVVVFTCNHCPTAQAYEDRLISVTEDYQDKNVAVVAISPNSPLSLLYDELGYSDLGDDYEEMKIRAKDKKYNFPYLYDGDTHEASIKYGPVATPHAFVFDQERELRYVGRLDGSEKPGSANAEDLRTAIDAVLVDNKVNTPVTKTFGCSIKWAWKNEWKEKVYAQWENKPVELNEINENGIKNLLKNDSEKLRLINIWATWCGPCLIEYPEFIIMQRMFGGRDFEFISISADKPDQKEKALKFLNQKNSAVTNYIFNQENTYALIEAVDPDWQGALPYTALVEPGGKKVHVQQGIIDPLELRKIIVEHPMMGRYY